VLAHGAENATDYARRHSLTQHARLRRMIVIPLIMSLIIQENEFESRAISAMIEGEQKPIEVGHAEIYSCN
jgi:hypothetical protein